MNKVIVIYRWRWLSKCLPELCRAGERPGSRDRVRCRLRPVHLELDARIGAFVCSRETDGCRTGIASISNVNLCAFLLKVRGAKRM
jgi:hypothetical protein